MTYDAFVYRPLLLRRRIAHQIEDVQLKESICMKASAPLQERVQTSVSNTTEINYIRYIDAKNRLSQLAGELEEAQAELREFLYKNLSPDEADILEWRYIDDKSIQDIADIRDLSYSAINSRICRANRKARGIYDACTDKNARIELFCNDCNEMQSNATVCNNDTVYNDMGESCP